MVRKLVGVVQHSPPLFQLRVAYPARRPGIGGRDLEPDEKKVITDARGRAVRIGAAPVPLGKIPGSAEPGRELLPPGRRQSELPSQTVIAPHRGDRHRKRQGKSAMVNAILAV
jgi:hypothetical protein